MDDAISTLENTLLDVKSKKYVEIAKVDFNTLKQQAITFISKIRSKEEGFLHGANFQEIYSTFALNLGKAKNKNFMRECFIEAEKLENAINHFLGREILFTAVNPQGEILFYDEEALIEIYKKLGSSGVLVKPNGERYGNGKGKISISKSKAVKEFNDAALREMHARVQEATEKKAQVFQEALARHDDEEKNYKKQNKKLQNTFYWWVSKNKLHWYEPKYPEKTYNKGRIAEAYVENIVNNKWGFNTRLTNLETSLKYLFYSIQLDTVPAILKGDVIVDDFGNLHLQVKLSNNASTAAIGQYIALAYYIISQGETDLTPEGIKNVLQKSQDLNHTAAQDIFVDLFNYASQKAFNENWEELNKKVIA